LLRAKRPLVSALRGTGKAGESDLWRVLGGLERAGCDKTRLSRAIDVNQVSPEIYGDNIDLDAVPDGAIMGFDGKFGNLGRNPSRRTADLRAAIWSNI